MIKQKKGFFTFIFSLIPGAGELYMGFRRQGISIMILFWLAIGFAGVLQINLLLFTLPILWFYSFFNVHNLASLTDEEFYSLEDKFLFDIDRIMEDKDIVLKNYRNVFAGILIFLGASIIWNNSFSILYSILPERLYYQIRDIGRNVPQFVFAAAIIALGVYLIRGKKKELDNNENS